MSTGRDPLSIVHAFNEACNTNDVDRAMTFFADDAVITVVSPPPFAGTMNGKQAIREWLEPQCQRHLHVTSQNHQVAGDTVTWDASVKEDSLVQAGIQPYDVIAKVTVDDGTIRTFDITLTPETVQKVQSAQANA